MKRALLTLVAVVLATVAVDQLTKYAVVSRLTSLLDGKGGSDRVASFFGGRERATPSGASELTLVEGYAQLRYSENPGAAFGFLGATGEKLRRPILLFAGALAIGFLAFLYLRAGDEQRRLRLALVWMLAGSFSNFVDRVVRGYVIDFVELHWRDVPGLRWPTFNLADVGICIGLALLLREVLRSHAAEQSAGFTPGLSGS